MELFVICLIGFVSIAALSSAAFFKGADEERKTWVNNTEVTIGQKTYYVFPKEDYWRTQGIGVVHPNATTPLISEKENA